MDELNGYVAAWAGSAADVDALLGELSADDWAAPTDCPGWTVQDVVAHLAAIEAELARGTGPTQVVPLEGRSPASWYTEAGVTERRGRPAVEVVAEWRASVAERRATLAAHMPTEPEAPARSPGGLPWDHRTLLRNRALDTWVHEQDIRRATGRPGSMDTPGAELAATVFSSALPYVIGKKAGAPTGTRVAVSVDGVRADYVVDPRGRCVVADDAAEPDVALDLDREALTVLAAGRRTPASLPAGARADVVGDTELGERILAEMAVTV